MSRSSKFMWDRHSTWVELPSDSEERITRRILPRTVPLSARGPPKSVIMQPECANLSSIVGEGIREGRAPDYSGSAELWTQTVLPAVTWLYGWIDWQLNAKRRQHAPTIVEREHQEAFNDATRNVTDAMRDQPDRLAACIWRSMIAILTHFVSRMEPVVVALDRTQRELDATRRELEATRRELEQLREEHVGIIITPADTL